MKITLRLVIVVIFFCSSVYAENSGKEIFKSNCNQCHKLPDTAKRSPKHLAMILDIMQQVMATKGLTPLSMEDKATLLTYLQQHSQQSDSSEEVSTRDIFLVRCTLCHQAPDPEMLKAKQWKFVMMTMDQRMATAGIPPISKDDRAKILGYLKEHAR